MQNDRFDAINIPKELDNAVRLGIEAGIRQQKKKQKTKRAIRYATLAATAMLTVCLGILFVSNPSLAAKLPIIGRIFSQVQDKVSYKGDFDSTKETIVEVPAAETMTNTVNSTVKNPNTQTSNGLTVTVSEINCSAQALYIALCIESNEDFPADFIKTKQEDYVLDYDILSLVSIDYFDIEGMEKSKRGPENGVPGPYYIEGEFIDTHTFAGIIRVPLDAGAYPEQFTYYLEISDIYGELFTYEEETFTDPDGNIVILKNPKTKHYTGTWNFALDVTRKEDEQQVVTVNKTNADGLGIASVKKTAFEITAQILLPEDTQVYDYITVICDADGQILETQGDNAEVFSIYRRNTDIVQVYICDYTQYMNELKGSPEKIAAEALFQTQVQF
ncbi:hypothetical protein C809_00280 [Lachnospiraceae bacterium MD335]|nr:hypothetical protein C809_00280 [Lachnospiraceae bacterium MD335]